MEAVKHPRVVKFEKDSVSQQARFVAGEITKDQMMWNLRAMAEKADIFGWFNWTIWTRDGYTLPWERTCGAAGTPGQTANQGGVR